MWWLGPRRFVTLVRSAVYKLSYLLTYLPRFSIEATVITRRRSFAEYWKYFAARFNDVHAFDYNSTESERIWIKFGELRVYCLELALTDFGRDLRRSESGRPCGSFVFYSAPQCSYCKRCTSHRSRIRILQIFFILII